MSLLTELFAFILAFAIKILLLFERRFSPLWITGLGFALSGLILVVSLFYLVPVVTAGLDYVCLGNKLSLLWLVGMGAILIGLWLVFKTKVLKSTEK